LDQGAALQTTASSSSVLNNRRPTCSLENIYEGAGLANGKDDYRNTVVAGKRHRGSIHDFQPLGQHLGMRQAIEAGRLLVLLWVGGIDPVDLRSLEQGVASHFSGPQGGAGIGCEERIAGSSGEDENRAV